MNSKYLAAGVLTTAMLVFSGCDTLNSLIQLEKPTASLTGVSFGDVSLKQAELRFDVEIKNPYSVALPLLNLDYSLQSGGLPLLVGKADIASTIPAKSSKVVTLPANFKYLELLNALRAFKDVQPGSQIPYIADLGLSIDSPVAGTLRLPLSKQGTLTIPTVEDITDMDWRKLLQEGRYLEIFNK